MKFLFILLTSLLLLINSSCQSCKFNDLHKLGFHGNIDTIEITQYIDVKYISGKYYPAERAVRTETLIFAADGNLVRKHMQSTAKYDLPFFKTEYKNGEGSNRIWKSFDSAGKITYTGEINFSDNEIRETVMTRFGKTEYVYTIDNSCRVAKLVTAYYEQSGELDTLSDIFEYDSNGQEKTVIRNSGDTVNTIIQKVDQQKNVLSVVKFMNGSPFTILEYKIHYRQ
jgi:hypothetical protein